MNNNHCPTCKKGTRRKSLGSTTTCLGWKPIIGVDGKLENKDPNTTYHYYECLECGTEYCVKT